MCPFDSWVTQKINLCNQNSLNWEILEFEQENFLGYGVAVGQITKKDLINDKKRHLNLTGLHKH